MLYIHKNNQLLIYCESTVPKQRNKIINLDGNKNHKPGLFLDKFNGIQDNSLGNIMQTDMFQDNIFLNQTGSAIKILQSILPDNKGGASSNSQPLTVKSLPIKQGIKEFKVISSDEILILTMEMDLIVVNSQGAELASIKGLLSSKQIEEGWVIKGLELCPE